MSDPIEISTLNQAQDILRRLLEEDDESLFEIERYRFSGDLSKITFKIEGPRYHGTIPGNLARGIWEFQQEVYRAVAFGVTGIDDIRKIGGSLEPYTLVFKVSESSTGLDAYIEDLIRALRDGFVSMESKHKAIVIVTAVITLTAGWGLENVLSNYVEAETRVQLEQEKTKQMKLISDASKYSPAAQRWSDAAENGARSIVKSAPDATSISIGAATINKDQIQEINSRSSRDVSDTVSVSGKFRIIGFKRQGEGIARFTLGSKDGEIPAVLDEQAFDNEQLDKFWSSAQHDQLIDLEIQITRVGSVIRRAWVSDIPGLNESRTKQ